MENENEHTTTSSSKFMLRENIRRIDKLNRSRISPSVHYDLVPPGGFLRQELYSQKTIEHNEQTDRAISWIKKDSAKQKLHLGWLHKDKVAKEDFNQAGKNHKGLGKKAFNKSASNDMGL